MEVEAFDDGVLLRILAAEGDTVPVNTVCAYVGEAGEAIPETAPAPAAAAPATLDAAAAPPVPAPITAVTAPAACTSSGAAAAAAAPATPVATTSASARLAISPRASRLAAEAGLDPRTITGTGPGGRIVERDVRAAIAARRGARSAGSVRRRGIRGSADAGRDRAPSRRWRARRRRAR